MSHACDRSRLPEERADFLVSIEATGQKELQRDVALESRIERTVDLAERATPHALKALERSPMVQRPRRWAIGGRSCFELGFVQQGYLEMSRQGAASRHDAARAAPSRS